MWLTAIATNLRRSLTVLKGVAVRGYSSRCPPLRQAKFWEAKDVDVFFLSVYFSCSFTIVLCATSCLVCRCARRSVSQFLVHGQDVWNAGNTYQHSSRVFVFQGYPATLMLLLHAEGEQLILRLEKNKWVFLSSVLKMPNLLHHMMSIYTHLPDLITNSQKRLAGVMWCVQGRIK